jgi:ATP-binding cassette subfamily E protein 1
MHPQFDTDVMKPDVMSSSLRNICGSAGGELQRVAITLCLGKAADIYLIDEPSAYLDSEQRIVAAKVGRKHTRSRKIHTARGIGYGDGS